MLASGGSNAGSPARRRAVSKSTTFMNGLVTTIARLRVASQPIGSVAQWIRRRSTEPKIPGSIPGRVTFHGAHRRPPSRPTPPTLAESVLMGPTGDHPTHPDMALAPPLQYSAAAMSRRSLLLSSHGSRTSLDVTQVMSQAHRQVVQCRGHAASVCRGRLGRPGRPTAVAAARRPASCCFEKRDARSWAGGAAGRGSCRPTAAG